jgi:hypothetical protein
MRIRGYVLFERSFDLREIGDDLGSNFAVALYQS